MHGRERLLCVLVTALAGSAFALVGAPAAPDVLGSTSRPGNAPDTGEHALLRTPIVHADLPARPAAVPAPAPAPPRNSARRSAPEPRLPDEVRVSFTPTAHRLLGPNVRASLERRGARLRAITESDRGALGRVERGADDVGVLTGQPAHDEPAKGLVSRVLGYHVLAVVVHEQNPLRDLPRHLLRAVLRGDATLWVHVGVDHGGRVEVASVWDEAFADAAGTVALLGERLAAGTERLDNDDDVCRFVARNPYALGLCSLAAVARNAEGVRVLSIDGVAPTLTAYASGSYPFAQPLRILARDARRASWIGNELGRGALSPAR